MSKESVFFSRWCRQRTSKAVQKTKTDGTLRGDNAKVRWSKGIQGRDRQKNSGKLKVVVNTDYRFDVFFSIRLEFWIFILVSGNYGWKKFRDWQARSNRRLCHQKGRCWGQKVRKVSIPICAKTARWGVHRWGYEEVHSFRRLVQSRGKGENDAQTSVG